MLYEYNGQTGIKFMMKQIFNLLELMGYKEEELRIIISKRYTRIERTVNVTISTSEVELIVQSTTLPGCFEGEWYSYRLYDLYRELYHIWSDTVRKEVLPDTMKDVIASVNEFNSLVQNGTVAQLRDKVEELAKMVSCLKSTINESIADKR